MKIDGFRVASYKPLKHEWLQGAPYAVLSYISLMGMLQHSRLLTFLSGLGVDDVSIRRWLTDTIVEELLRKGDLYKVRDRLYAALPPYAIQRDAEEWIILGDTKVDRFIGEMSPIFEIQSSVGEDFVHLERILMATYEDSVVLFERAGIRPFGKDDLLALIPDIESIVEPIPWPGLEPPAFAIWEWLDNNCQWTKLESRANTPVGLCRGSAADKDGRIMFVRYFFRHRDGWSPLTDDEASLWVLKVADSHGRPFVADYKKADKKLRLSARVPNVAYLALRILGRGRSMEDGRLVVNGIDYAFAENICKKLAIKLTTRRE